MVANKDVKLQMITMAKYPLETSGNKAFAQATKTIDVAERPWMGPTRSQQQICL
jgi:hypothetical protein